MKQIKKILIVALAFVVGFLAITIIGGQATNAETAPMTEKGITYRAGATGRVFVEPDIAYLTVGATSEHEQAADAMAEVNEQIDLILAAIKDLGIDDDDIKTATISIDVNYDYSGSKPVMTGYTARNSLALTIRDLDRIALVLDVVIESGANNVSGLSFDKEDKNDAYDEALALAVERAKAKVDVLHAAAGVEGSLQPVSFAELGVQTYGQNTRYMEMAATEDAMGVTVMPGTIEVVAQVSVEYIIAD